MGFSLKELKDRVIALKIPERVINSKAVQRVLASKKFYSRIFMVTAGLMLLLTFVLPLWKIRLEAPQYPIPLGMYIYINKIADEAPHDVKNINLLNHYVGMKEIPEHMPEFDVFPIVILAMALLGVLAGLTGKHKVYLAWLILMVLLSTAGLYDFYLWEYDYGHNLNPHAILKFTNADGTPMGFQPPIFGTKHILNFVAHSYPSTGGLALFMSMFLAFVSYRLGYFGSKEEKSVSN